jgi:hypothetical protein
MPGFELADKYEALASGYDKLGLEGAAEAVRSERVATAMTIVDLHTIPYPLRSEEYAGILFAYGRRQRVTTDKFHKLSRLHTQRQALLRERLDSGELTSLQLVVGEWALAGALRYEGGLETLLQADRDPGISIQVLPFGSGITRLSDEPPFSIYTMPGSRQDEVVAGNDRKAKVVSDQKNVVAYRNAVCDVVGACTISLQESFDRIQTMP